MADLAAKTVASNWLDAYSHGELETLIQLYSEDATHACGCDGQRLIAGKHALRAYWIDRFATHAVYGLVGVKSEDEGVSVSYWTSNSRVVQARLVLNGQGKIAHAVCGPEVAEVRSLKNSDQTS